MTAVGVVEIVIMLLQVVLDIPVVIDIPAIIIIIIIDVVALPTAAETATATAIVDHQIPRRTEHPYQQNRA